MAAKRKIVFKKDKVEVTEPTADGESKTEELSKDEYNKEYNKNIQAVSKGQAGSGAYTGKIGELIGQNLRRREVEKIRSDIQKQNLDKQLFGEALNIDQQQETQTTQELKLNELRTNKNNELEQQKIQEQKAKENPEGIVNNVNAFGEKYLGAGSLKGYNPINKQNIALLVDVVRVGVTGKKPLRVQQASGAISDSISTLKEDINLVKSGNLDYYDALNDILIVEDNLNKLASFQKGVGSENLRYWSDEGNEIEQEVLKQQRTLEALKVDLLNAKNNFELFTAQQNLNSPVS